MAFIVFEGGDGAGKSTQARALFRQMQRSGHPVFLTREPGGTPLGESLRRLLKNRRGATPLSELLLFQAARAQLVQQVIQPALQKQTSVICDRFIASTVAYQGYGRGLDLLTIDQLNLLASSGLSPDLNILLDLPPQSIFERRIAAEKDTFDAAPQDFHQRVREGYLAQASQEPSRWLVLDATRPRRALALEIWQKVRPLTLCRKTIVSQNAFESEE